ncbi:hypothetical protein [Streptomyces sp. NPDC090025]
MRISCKVKGENVNGNDLWYKLANGRGWIAARYARNIGTIPFCG